MVLDGRARCTRSPDRSGHSFWLQGEDSFLVEYLAHFRRYVCRAQGFQPFAMDTRILVFILDLAPTLRDGDGTCAFRTPTPQRDEGIPAAPKAASEIARGLRSRVEMLMEHPERRGVHEAVLPRKLPEFRVAFVPQQRIPGSVYRMHVRAGGVSMSLLVPALRNLRHMRVHRSIREDETNIFRALAAFFEVIELEARKVGYEVGVPQVALDVVLGDPGAVLALAFEVPLAAGSVGEGTGVVEDEVEVVEQVDRDRRVVRAGDPYRVLAAGVEHLVLTVERDREQGLGTPLEGSGLTVGQPYLGRSVTGQHVAEHLVQVLDRPGLFPGFHLKYVVGHEVASAVCVSEATARLVTVPGAGFELQQVMAEVEVDGDALAFGPVAVWIQQDSSIWRGGDIVRGLIAINASHARRVSFRVIEYCSILRNAVP